MLIKNYFPVSGGVCLALILFLTSCSHPSPKEARENLKTPERDHSEASAPTIDYERAARLNVELGMTYLKAGEGARAKTKLNRALELGPNLPETHYAMGFYLESIGEKEAAEKAYRKAIQVSPQSGKAHNNYGAFLCRNQKFPQAEKEFLLAIKDTEYTETAETLENAGLCALETKNAQKATEYFEWALRHDPNRSEALLELGILHFEAGNFQASRTYYDRFEKLRDPMPRSLWLGMKLAQHFGEQDKAANYKQLLESPRGETEAYKGRRDQNG